MKTLYTAEALATGEGRDGHGRTSDGTLDLDLAIPKEMGGSGNGANPEQLFAIGYAACYHSALRLVGRQEKADVEDSAVGARVSLGQLDNGGFGLAVELEITLPNLDHDAAQTARRQGASGVPVLQRHPRQHRRQDRRHRRLSPSKLRGDRDFSQIRDLPAVSAPASVQSLREPPDPGDEPVEEHARINLNANERVGLSAPVTAPVGDRHAAG